MGKVFLERGVVELVYKFDEKSYRECLKRWVDRSSTIQFFFCPQTYSYMDTNTDHFTPLALHVRGNDWFFSYGFAMFS